MLGARDVEAARAAADELAEIAARQDVPFLRALSSGASGAVLLAGGNAREALAKLKQCWSLWCELQAPYEAARVQHQIALAYRSLGDEEKRSWSSMRPGRRFNAWAPRWTLAA